MPPTRLLRYCCQKLKETGGQVRFTVTGVRWAESAARSDNQGLVTVYNADKALRENPSFQQTPKGGVILNNDNTDGRDVLESCYRLRKTVLNPIINWTDDDVWDFIKVNNIPYCKLYDEGFKRLGCIGCPMNTHAKEELERYPKYKQAYLRAFERMLKDMPTARWKTAEDVMEWWLSDRRKSDKPIDGQMEMEL